MFKPFRKKEKGIMMKNKNLIEISKQIAQSCEEHSRDKEFKSALGLTNTIWNQKGFNQYTTIGPVMKLFRAEGDDRLKECWEYINTYFTLGEAREKNLNKDLRSANFCLKNKHLPEVRKEMYKVGRSYEYLQELADAFAKTANLPNYQIAFDFMVYRIFYQTYIGKIAEEKMRDYLNKVLAKYGAYVYWAPDEYDAKFSIDLIIKKNGKEIFGVQVKPKSYYDTENKARAHEEQMKKNTTQNRDFKKLTNCDTIYLYYGTNYNPLISETDKARLIKTLKES